MILLYDAHNHLQDERLRAEDVRLAGCVVDGSCEEDWPQVSALAKKHTWITPAFGLHPWYIKERTPNWFDTMRRFLDGHSNATVGEIGLDRWIENPDVADQEKVFLQQLALAAERNIAASVHCLKAWGHLEECLKNHPRPNRGFLIHAYGGPPEMISNFEKLGAYFSFSGYIAHERKTKHRESFCKVRLQRLLLETDAPDMAPPPELSLVEGEINHPQNIERFYPYAAQLRQMSVEDLASAVEANYQRLFLAPSRASS